MSGRCLDVCGVTGKVGENEGSLHRTKGEERGRERGRERERERERQRQREREGVRERRGGRERNKELRFRNHSLA